jgi:hypothetical protein
MKHGWANLVELHQSRVTAEMTVACCTVKVLFVLLQSVITVESSIVEYAMGTHGVKIVVNTAHFWET